MQQRSRMGNQSKPCLMQGEASRALPHAWATSQAVTDTWATRPSHAQALALILRVPNRSRDMTVMSAQAFSR